MSQNLGLVTKLMGRALYESPVLKRNAIGVDSRMEGRGMVIKHNYDRPVDMSVIDWLEENSLFKVCQDSAHPSIFTYVFIGNNQALCALTPERQDITYSGIFTYVFTAADGSLLHILASEEQNLKSGNVLGTQDHTYLWRIQARYHPADGELPVEIADALKSMGFERK